MRSFLTGLLLLVAFVSGTAALTAYVADQVVLAPDRTGDVIARAVGQKDLRDELLSRAVPGYDQLPAPVKARVDQAAESEAAQRALKKVNVRNDGTVSLAPLRDGIATELRANGLGPVADRITSASGSAEVELPSRYTDKLDQARSTTRNVWTKGGLVAVIALVLAVLVSRRHVRTVGSAGLTVLLASGAAALIYFVLPDVARAVSSDPLVEAGAEAMRSDLGVVFTTLLPVLVIGGAMLLVGLLGGRARRQ